MPGGGTTAILAIPAHSQEWLCHPRPLVGPPTLPHIVIGSGDNEGEKLCGEDGFEPFEVGKAMGTRTMGGGRSERCGIQDSKFKMADGGQPTILPVLHRLLRGAANWRGECYHEFEMQRWPAFSS